MFYLNSRTRRKKVTSALINMQNLRYNAMKCAFILGRPNEEFQLLQQRRIEVAKFETVAFHTPSNFEPCKTSFNLAFDNTLDATFSWTVRLGQYLKNSFLTPKILEIVQAHLVKPRLD